jgi:acyl-CoA synthetase (AMP-forming)/AMP-acid ligase II
MGEKKMGRHFTQGTGVSRLPSDSETLSALLRERAQAYPEKIAYIFLPRGEADEQKITYGALHRWAQSIAARLQQECKPGSRAILMFPPGLSYIAAFFACLYARVVAIPIYPPRFNRSVERLVAVINSANVGIALTDEATAARVREVKDLPIEVKSLGWLITSDLQEEIYFDSYKPVDSSPNDLAFLQYTSGSTGNPKGVMLTHKNLMSNQEMIFNAFEEGRDSVVVGWLPFYHDMGLIGNIMQPLYVGAPCILMPPVAFLQKPVRWLKAISTYGGTLSGGPNFAYDMCVDRITETQKEGLDLSQWRLAFNGSEPIRPQTLVRFTKAFSDVGFNGNSFFPCYGMAEASLFVSGIRKVSPSTFAKFSDDRLGTASPIGPETVNGTGFVSCGFARAGQDIAVVDPAHCLEVGPGEQGEIWLAGDNVAQGYWNQSEITASSFNQQLPGKQGNWFRTGDLGCLVDDELFITGRCKDLIIINGKNHYPQDIEYTVEKSDEMIASNSTAAFALDSGQGEELVIVTELERNSWRQDNLESLTQKIMMAIVAEHEIKPTVIAIIKPGQLPKTSSGKIQRIKTKNELLKNSLVLLFLQTEKNTVLTLPEQFSRPDAQTCN